MNQPANFEQSIVNQVKQVAKRGHYDAETIYGILDMNLVGNVGFSSQDGPFIIPMLFARSADELLIHGSTKSRLMQMLCSGQRVCVSVTNLDGLVFAKSLFHHSMNYRSVSVFGIGRELEDDSERMDALKIITDKVMPGRWDDARQPNPQEMKATCVAAIKIETASAKIRSGPPAEDTNDLRLPVWTGVIPLVQKAHAPVTAPEDEIVSMVPQYIEDWQSRFNQQAAEFIKVPELNSNSVLGLTKSYQPRRTTMIGVREINGWQLKLYSILLDNEEISEQVIEAALKHAQSNVSWPNRSQGYGFITIHLGEHIWLLVDLWVDDILRHFLFRSTYENPTQFADGPSDGSNACVWELEVTKHERDSWVNHVLSKPADPSFDDYLSDKIEINAS